MARGDVTVFDQFLEDVGRKVHQLETDTLNIGVVDDNITPSASTSDPRWGAGGSTNLSANEIGTGGGYTGPVDMAATYSQAAGLATFDLTVNQAWLQNAGGDNDWWWGIIYNDTSAGKECVGYVELGGPISIIDGDITITWNASGFFTIS